MIFNSHCGRVESKLGPLGTSVTSGIPAPCDCEDGELGGLKIVSGNWSTRRKPAHRASLTTTNPTWPDQAAAVGSKRLTAWATAQPGDDYWVKFVFVTLQFQTIIYSELLGFCTLYIVRYSTNYKTHRLGNWICFSPQVRGESSTMLVPLESANLNHTTRTQQRSLPTPLTWGRKQIQFPKHCVL
jgi:hypothetical protein